MSEEIVYLDGVAFNPNSSTYHKYLWWQKYHIETYKKNITRRLLIQKMGEEAYNEMRKKERIIKHREASKRWYENNKEQVKAKNRKLGAKRRAERDKRRALGLEPTPELTRVRMMTPEEKRLHRKEKNRIYQANYKAKKGIVVKPRIKKDSEAKAKAKVKAKTKRLEREVKDKEAKLVAECIEAFKKAKENKRKAIKTEAKAKINNEPKPILDYTSEELDIMIAKWLKNPKNKIKDLDKEIEQTP